MTGDRLPPQNLEAEQSVIGSMLIDKQAIYAATEILHADDFYRDTHKHIFQAICSLSERSEPADLVTLKEELSRQGRLEEIGGASYLTALANVVPTAANVTYYARIVREKALLRNLINAGTRIVEKCFAGDQPIEDLLDQAEQKIFEVGRRSHDQGFVILKDVLLETFDRIERLYERKSGITGLPTGFTDLDNITSGLQEADLVIIAARPSMGKTTLALNMAQHIAVEENLPVAFFSLEMSSDQLAQRLLCSLAGIDSQRLRRGMLSADDWPKLTHAVGPLSKAPLYIDDTPSLSSMEMRAKARRLQAEHGLKAVFVDYLQLMRGSARAENRQQEISEISRSLKALAKELKVPVVALSQLSRAVEQRDNKRPILSDLLESGGIEANADVVAFIYRDDYYNSRSEQKNIAEVIVAKQRNGPIGKVELYFMNAYNKFLNLSRREEVATTGDPPN